MKRFLLFVFFLTIFVKGFSQDKNYTRMLIDSLCSERFAGRGYIEKGDSLAADFIKNQFVSLGLKSCNNNFFQPFKINVNTFPDELILKAGNKTLIPGEDFMISASSPSIRGIYRVTYLNRKNVADIKVLKRLLKKNYTKSFIVIDTSGIGEKKITKILSLLRYNNVLKSKGIIYLNEKKPIWGLSDASEILNCAVFDVYKEAFPVGCNEITVDVENKFLKDYTTHNVIGMIEGNVCPDSLIVFIAHYDHLGKMGKNVFFPGANDNASGVSFILNLARHFVNPANTPKYTMVFIALAAEELGLLGADYFTKHAPINLKNIRFLINFDMVGTGDDGIRVVNGSVFPKEFAILDSLNNKNNYLKTVSKRGEAANSDHYPFYSEGVKSFFIYTTGGINAYHNQHDKPETLPLTKYDELFKLVINFVKVLE